MRGQTIAHRKQGIDVDRLARRHALAEHANRNAANQVDGNDHKPGDGVALDELHRAIHGPEELAFLFQRSTAQACLMLFDVAIAQVAVDGHLLAGQRIQRKAGRDLGDALGPFGDHDELDNRDDQKDHEADDQLARNHEITKGFNNLTRIRLQQDQARCRDGQGQSENSGNQNDRGQRREIERIFQVKRHHQQQDSRGEVDPNQRINQPCWKRQDHHHDGRHQQDDNDHILTPTDGVQPFVQALNHSLCPTSLNGVTGIDDCWVDAAKAAFASSTCPKAISARARKRCDAFNIGPSSSEGAKASRIDRAFCGTPARMYACAIARFNSKVGAVNLLAAKRSDRPCFGNPCRT